MRCPGLGRLMVEFGPTGHLRNYVVVNLFAARLLACRQVTSTWGTRVKLERLVNVVTFADEEPLDSIVPSTSTTYSSCKC